MRNGEQSNWGVRRRRHDGVVLDRLVNVPDDFLLLVGGERLPEKLLDRVLAKTIDLVNVYGPTETTIWSTSRLYRSGDGRGGLPVSIGVPFAGETVYVLDRALRPLPPGAIGELCIGGSGLARGYLNQKDLTAERFVTPPSGPGRPVAGRLYRTGDFVRLLPSGALEFVGRNDSQVKSDGHRIEIGEVEAALADHPAVRQSVVVPLKSHSTVLSAITWPITRSPRKNLPGTCVDPCPPTWCPRGVSTSRRCR